MNKELKKANFLTYMKNRHSGGNPLHKNLMGKDEIKFAEQLVKEGRLSKGTAIEDARMKIYYYK